MQILSELRYTVKVMLKNIHFTLLCVSVIAIGCAIVLPLYALVDTLVFKTLPFEQGKRFLAINKVVNDPDQRGLARYDAFHAHYFRENASSFELVQAWRDASATVSDGDYAEAWRSAEIAPELLQATAVAPLLGRLFVAADSEPGAQAVAILSYELWQTYYAGRADIVGSQSRINGQARVIVGVMPQGFAFPVAHRLWLPLSLPKAANPGEGDEDLILVGILADGVSRNDASTEIRLLQARILADWQQFYPHIERSEALPYTRGINAGQSALAFLVLLGSIVLLVATNIGNLFVARGQERIPELAIRSALGASPPRIALALMLESFLVCLLGLLPGLVLANFGLAYIDGVLTNINNGAVADRFWLDLSLNGRILSLSAVAMLTVWLGCGGWPAWRLSRANLSTLLGTGSKGGSGSGTTRLSKILVNVQLVLGCALLTLGIIQTLALSGGQQSTLANSATLYSAKLAFNEASFADAQARQSYFADFGRGLSAQAGVSSTALTTSLPGDSGPTTPYNIEDQDLLVNERYPTAYVIAVTNEYFDVVDIAVAQGRKFGPEDTQNGLPVAIIDQRLANKLWPGASPLGKRLQLNPQGASPWLTVVGVSAPSIQEGFLRKGEEGIPIVYRPLRQSVPAQVTAIIGSTVPGFDFMSAFRTAAAQTNRDIPVTDMYSIVTLEAARDDTENFNMNIFYSIMSIAIYLTAAATYGLAARAVGRRKVETGIRMALGADRSACLRVFLKDGLSMVVTGLGIGGILAPFITYMLLAGSDTSSAALDLLIPTVIAVVVSMATLVMLANYIPARKIIAMEPGDALRHE